MPNADDVVAALEQAKRKLTEAKSKGLQAASLFGRAVHTVGYVLGRAGANSPLLAEMRQKETALVQEVMRLDALMQRVDRAIAEVRAAATLGRTGGSAPPSTGSTPPGAGVDLGGRRAGGPEPSKPRTELPPPPRYNQGKAAEIRPHVGADKAVGKLYRADTGEAASGLIISGREGPGRGGPKLVGDFKRWESLTEHTEGHAAAIMRRDGIDDGELYLNMHPCRKPAGCHLNIDKALPDGSRMTVWVVNADGSTLRRIYKGTGEATEP